MSNNVTDYIASYFEQQEELSMPAYVFTSAPGVENETVKKVSVNPEKTYEEKRAALVELFHEVKNCKGCSLGATRKKLVFGSGNAGASLMVIGEAPGYDEDMKGLPFVGKAGALLTKMMSAINLDREKDLFITNVMKCRPPENRDPNSSETLACMPILKRQISIIKPKAILVLGRVAAKEILGEANSISQMRTTIHNYNGIPAVVTYHPAALLRNEQYKRPAWEDLQKLSRILKDTK